MKHLPFFNLAGSNYTRKVIHVHSCICHLPYNETRERTVALKCKCQSNIQIAFHH